MPSFAQHFALNKEQSQLDFVNVPLETDIPLFIDPFALSQQVDRWSQEAQATLVTFFQMAIDLIRAGETQRARRLLRHLREPNETHLGLSSGAPQGAGIGQHQADQLLEALTQSAAVQTGFLSSLQECELLVRGIGPDKISDLTTNIIRAHLIDYTAGQCELLDVPTQAAPLPPCFDVSSRQWVSRYADVPVCNGEPVLLVPKIIARWDPSYNHRKYYRHFVLNFLQREHLEAGGALVQTLKDGTRVVHKTDLEARFPCAKEFLYKFSRDHPEVLDEYREALEDLELSNPGMVTDPDAERAVADLLIEALMSIPPGNSTATEFHRLMVGVVEFLFFPDLVNPTKENEIHQGRKRIDILMSNAARRGIFDELNRVRGIPCAYVPIECKNYRNDVANPELDQLSGRFSVNRGTVGILSCRQFEDRALFVQRCRDTFNDGRGLIMAVDDDTVIEMLEAVSAGDRGWLPRICRRLVDEVAAA